MGVPPPLPAGVGGTPRTGLFLFLVLAVVVNRRVVRKRKLSIDLSEFERKLMTNLVGKDNNKVDDRP